MKLLLNKLALAMVINLFASHTLFARLVEQKSLQFSVKTEELMKGETHYFLDILAPRKTLELYPEIYDIDSLALFSEPHTAMVLVKTIYTVSKPVGFFDEQQLSDEKFVTHIMGQQKINKKSPHHFQISVPGEMAHTYQMKTFFDADDLSTLSGNKVIRGVSAAKRLDVISQGSSMTTFTEYTDYNKFFVGAVAVTSYIPLKEEVTLVIKYELKALDKEFIKDLKNKNIKAGFLNEIQESKTLLESYK